MSIADKKVLLLDFEKGLSSVLTADNIARVMQTLSESLNHFEVTYINMASGNMESAELLETFLNAKRIEGRSEKTVERYGYIIQRMYDSINVPIKQISVFHLRNYLSQEKTRGVSDSTLDGTRQVLSAYFGWLHKEGLIQNNPTVNLNPIKFVKKVRKPYTQIDIEKMKENCKSSRDKAIISLLLSTGCRISEVCSLNRNDIDFQNKEITVLGKGNKERTVFVDDVTIMMLRRYLGDRKDAYPALFIGKGTDRMKPGGIRKMLNTLADEAGIDHVHPHRFRRTLATNLIDHGMAVQEVAAILGHEKLDTTMKYVYLSKTNVKNNYNRYAG